MTPIFRHFVPLLVLVLCPDVLFGAAADENADSGVSGPLCGMYAVYGAARLLGERPDFATLMRHEFVPSQEGSSIEDVQAAARAFGLTTRVFVDMGVSDLRDSPYPIILHVRSDFGNEYDHYVLLIRVSGDRALISDSGNAPTWVRLDRLLPLWSGRAIVVGRGPLETQGMLLRSRVTVAGYIAGVVLLVWALRRGFAASRSIPRGLSQAVALLAIAGALAVCEHSFAYGGFLRDDGNSVQGVEDRYTVAFDRTVSMADLQRLARSGALIADARGLSDFRAGHIPGAVSLYMPSLDGFPSNPLPKIDKKPR
jgi:hypothetical protein